MSDRDKSRRANSLANSLHNQSGCLWPRSWLLRWRRLMGQCASLATFFVPSSNEGHRGSFAEGFFWQRSERNKHTRCWLMVEELELRTVPSPLPIGPSPQYGFPGGSPTNPVSETTAGRVTSLAYTSYTDGSGAHAALLMGTAGGGIWRTVQTTSTSPVWTPVSENSVPQPTSNPVILAGTMNIGSLTVDPTSQGNVIYAGTGEANYSSDSNYGSGILKSSDGGQTWQLLSSGPQLLNVNANALSYPNGAFYRHSISRILVNPLHPDNLFASVVPSFEGLPPLTDQAAVASYVAVDGVYESTNSGKKWDKISSGGIVTDMDFTLQAGVFTLFLGVGAVNPLLRNLYDPTGGTLGGIWATVINQSTFLPTSSVHLSPLNGAPSPIDVARVSLASDERVNGFPLIYAAVSQFPGDPSRSANSYNGLEGLYVSGNNGGTWIRYGQLVAPTGYPLYNYALNSSNPLGQQGWYNLPLALDPAHPNIVYLGGVGSQRFGNAAQSLSAYGVFLSTDYGAHWIAIDGAPLSTTTTLPHPDQHALLPVGNTLFDGNDGGVWSAVINFALPSVTWYDLDTAGLQTNLVMGVDSNHRAVNPIYTEGSQDNGAAQKVGGGPWNSIVPGDWGQVLTDASGTGTYMASASSGAALVLAQVSGGPWQNVSQGLANDSFPFYPAMSFDPRLHPVIVNGVQSSRQWIAIGSTRLWLRHANSAVQGGNSVFQWDVISTDPSHPTGYLEVVTTNVNGMPVATPAQISAIEFDNSGNVYVGFKDGAVWRGQSAGLNSINYSWQLLTPAGPPPWGANPVGSIAIDPQNPLTVFVGIQTFGGGQQVYRYQPGAVPSWGPASGSGTGAIPAFPVNALALVHQGQNAILYAGTNGGVWYAVIRPGDPGYNWTRLNGMPYVQVTTLQIASPTSTLGLIIGTHGRGVWDPNGNLPAASVEPTAYVGIPQIFALGNFAVASGHTPSNAMINWGDSSTSSGTMTASGDTWSVTGQHVFGTAGSYLIMATVTDGSSTIMLSITVAVEDAPLTLVTLASTVSGTEEQPINNAVLATFTDPYSGAAASEFSSAIIDWGDGSTSADGVVQKISSSAAGSTFTVTGSHTYTDKGVYPVHVTIEENAGSAIVDMLTAQNTAAIGGAITVQPLQVDAIEGQVGSIPLATFTDSLAGTTPGDYSTSINWGDGPSSTPGVVWSTESGFTIYGTHAYGDDLPHPITVAISRSGSAATVMTGEIFIDALLTASAVSSPSSPIHVSEGVPFTSLQLATFTDADPNAGSLDPSTHFQATIDWGDAAATEHDAGGGGDDNGSVVSSGSGIFAGSGDHVYTEPGTYTVTVTIMDEDGSTTSVTDTLSVAALVPTVAGEARHRHQGWQHNDHDYRRLLHRCHGGDHRRRGCNQLHR